jgi:hypothetical protein
MSDTDNPILEPAALFYGDNSQESDSEPTIEDEIIEDQPDESVEASSEEVEEESEASSDDMEGGESDESEDLESLVYEIKGREVSAKQILEWEQGDLRQKDYTKKTQALANDRRAFEKDKEAKIKEEADKRFGTLNESVATLEALIKEADEAIDWDDLREFDTAEFLKQKEIKEKREAAISKAKSQIQEANKPKPMSQEEVDQQQEVFKKNNPEWFDSEGKDTPKKTKDLEVLTKYLTHVGMSKEKQEQLKTANDWQVVIDASRYWESRNRASETKKKVVKIKPTIKTKQNSTVKRTAAEIMYGN